MKKLSNFSNFGKVNEKQETATKSVYDTMKAKCEKKFGEKCKVAKKGDGCTITLDAEGNNIGAANAALKALSAVTKGCECKDIKFSAGKLKCYCC